MATNTTTTTKTTRAIGWLARKSARATVGVGHMALRGAYALGEGGSVFVEEFSAECAVISAEHEAIMAARDAKLAAAKAAYLAQQQTAVAMTPTA